MGWSLKRQQLLMVVLILAPLVALSVFVFYQIRGYSERELGRALTSRTEEIAQRLEGIIVATGDLALVVRAAWSADLDCDAFLARIHAAFPRYNVIGVGDSSGRLICSSPPTQGRDVSDRALFQTVIERESLTVGTVQVSRTDGTHNMVVVVPFAVEAGPLSHSVGAGLRLDWLSDHLMPAGHGEQAIIGVLDHDLRIVARSPDHAAWIGRDVEGDEARALIAQGGGLLTVRNEDGVQRRFHGRWVEVGGQRFFVYSGLPERALTELARQVTFLQLGAISLGGLGLLLVTGLLMRRQLLEPLSDAQRFAERIARAEFPGRIRSRPTSTEVASLIGSLQTMADTLTRNAEDMAAACRMAQLGYWRIRRDDRTMVWSRELRELFGLGSSDHAPEPGEESLDTLLDLVVAEDRAAVQTELDRAAAEGAAYRVTFRIRRPDAAIRDMAAQGEPAGSIHENGQWLTGVCQDVTEQRELEERLRQVQRLEAVGQLTGGVAHDFNNLLTVIIGNADLLAEQIDDASALRAQATMVRDAALRASELTQRLLAFSRRQRLEAQAVDVNALIETMRALLRRTLGAAIVIETDLEPGLGPAWVDATQLESALLNLCLNARDAMPRGGTLTLSTRSMSLSVDAATAAPGARAAELAPGDYLEISVVDTGEGMDEAVRRQAFEPYFTTREVGKGSGLGLSMVYGFAKQSHGIVEIDSAPGRGTRVRLCLPSAGAAPSESLPSATDVVAGSGRGECILLVDDDPLVQDSTRRQLESLGYRVEVAGSGAEALDAFDRLESVALLFSDIVMPGGMTGLELAQRVRERLPDLPVILASGYSDAALQDSDLTGRGVLMLGKPYRLQALAAVIRQALDSPPPRSA